MKARTVMNQTAYFENELKWLCHSCFEVNPNTWDECDGCGKIKGVFQTIRKPVKYMTWKEWKKFKWFKEEQVNGETFYMDMQMLMIQKYDVKLTDYSPKWNRRYKTFKKYVNMKNFNKGMNTFNKSVEQFSGSIGAVGNEIGGGTKRTRSNKSKRNMVALWGTKKRKSKNNHVGIWSDPPKEKRRKKYQRKPDRDRDNVNKIWGKRR